MAGVAPVVQGETGGQQHARANDRRYQCEQPVTPRDTPHVTSPEKCPLQR